MKAIRNKIVWIFLSAAVGSATLHAASGQDVVYRNVALEERLYLDNMAMRGGLTWAAKAFGWCRSILSVRPTMRRSSSVTVQEPIR